MIRQTLPRVPAMTIPYPASPSGPLTKANPSSATAIPVRAFVRLITTGMSAPPIGSVSSTPYSRSST